MERRNNSELAAEIVEALRSEYHGIPAEQHMEDHEFVREWITKQRLRNERAEKIKTQVGGWAIISFLGGIGSAAYHAFQYLREHLK